METVMKRTIRIATPVLAPGSDVTIGHKGTFHGCRVGSNWLTGMGAILLDGCEAGDTCIIGAVSLIGPEHRIPAGAFTAGTPAKVIRKLSAEEFDHIPGFAECYTALQRRCRTGAMKPF
jgi:carbonic anhydrase/acetyltransferase-like protein (isoleucine patch superfamily)